MALIEKISSSDLYHMACRMNRGDNFGYAGWNAIGDYLENLSEDLGEDIEIDIIGICCEYTMLESAQEVFDAYEQINPDGWEDMDGGEKLEAIEEFLQENTQVVSCEEGCIIFVAF